MQTFVAGMRNSNIFYISLAICAALITYTIGNLKRAVHIFLHKIKYPFKLGGPITGIRPEGKLAEGRWKLFHYF